ncbi:hypothetical protein IFT66_08545 [Rhizobium sp. CFBP 13726]|nr:hypothetical protein [Rhizobium sp. CFBP 13726]
MHSHSWKKNADMLSHPMILILVILLLWAASLAAIVLIPYAPLGVYILAALVFWLKKYVEVPISVQRVFYSAKPNPKFVTVIAKVAGKTLGFLTLFLTPFSLIAVFDNLLA